MISKNVLMMTTKTAEVSLPDFVWDRRGVGDVERRRRVVTEMEIGGQHRVRNEVKVEPHVDDWSGSTCGR